MSCHNGGMYVHTLDEAQMYVIASGTALALARLQIDAPCYGIRLSIRAFKGHHTRT